MPFKKGEVANPTGKPKGTLSAKTEEWILFRDWLLGKGMVKLQKDFDKLSSKERVDSVIKILEYFKPKLARTELTGQEGKELEIKITYTNE